MSTVVSHHVHEAKVELWDIGADRYPRPFNPQPLRIVRTHVEHHRGALTS